MKVVWVDFCCYEFLWEFVVVECDSFCWEFEYDFFLWCKMINVKLFCFGCMVYKLCERKMDSFCELDLSGN